MKAYKKCESSFKPENLFTNPTFGDQTVLRINYSTFKDSCFELKLYLEPFLSFSLTAMIQL